VIIGIGLLKYYPIQDKKNDPRAGTRPSSPQTGKKQRTNSTHRARGVSWNPFGSCLGSNGIDWRKNGAAQWWEITNLNKTVKPIPAPVPSPPSPQTGKTAPGLATQGKRGLVAPCWFLFGLQRDRLAQERPAQWWELANLNKTKNRSPRRHPALITPNGKNSARARHTGQKGSRGALLVPDWAPRGSIGARTGPRSGGN
jgi:hypothetical protein